MKTVPHRPAFVAQAVIGHSPPMALVALREGQKGRDGVLVAIVLAVLCALVVAFLPAPAEANGLTATAIFGIAEDQNLYAIDPSTGQVTGSTSTASLSLDGNFANAFALDRDKAQIYFMGDSTVYGTNSLFFYDRPSNTFGRVATAAELGIAAMQRNASFYDNKYWWIGTNDNKLHSAALTYAGGLPSGVASVSTFDITGVTGTSGAFTLNPNDIAINPLTQTLYGSDLTTTSVPSGSGEFFSISLANLGGPVPYTKLYDQPYESGPQVGVQLAYSDDYSTLYGQDFTTGRWYTVSTGAGGTFTATGGETTALNLRMRDLAGGVQAVPEPGSLAIAGSGLLVAGVVIYRNRKRRRRRAAAPRDDG